MDFKKFTLPNGLRVIHTHMPSIESVTVTVWVQTGSRFEEKKVNGLSHFLEHMVFKGSKKRPTAKEIAESVDSIGGEFNAGTSKEWTNFYIKARSEKVDNAFDILSDMVLNPILSEEEIEREKGVIVQEINMYEDNPLMKIGDIFENIIYKGTKLSWDIAGDSKSVNAIKKQDFVNYRKESYFAPNMLLTVSGSISEAEVKSLADKYFRDVPKKGGEEKKPNESLDPKGDRVFLKYKKTDQTHIMIGFPGTKYNDETKYAQSVLSAILGGGMSSRMFTEVRERRGLCYVVRSSVDHAHDNGYFATYSGVRTDKVEEAIEVILDQYEGLKTKKYPITDAELKKAKEYIKGHLALSLEDTKDINSYFGYQEIYTKDPITPEELFEKLDAVTKEELYALAEKYFIKDKLHLAVIGPQKKTDKEKFVSLLK